MATKIYKLKLEVVLEPIWHQEPPHVIVDLSGQLIFDGSIQNVKHIIWEADIPACRQTLSVKFCNKKDTDTCLQRGLDKAVKIQKISFNGIASDTFIWQGQYRPEYPKIWAKQQIDAGHQLLPVLENQNYLGWNGVWDLDFEVPIFTWIHKVESLGWIHH